MNLEIGDLTLERNNGERDFLTIDEAIQYLWKWRKYRNEVFWKSFYRFGTASIVITLIPYLLPDLIAKLGYAVLVFPLITCLLSVVGAYLMAVQYVLYVQINKKFRRTLGKYNAEDIPNTKFINRIFRNSLGRIVALVMLTYGIIGQLINGFVLFSLVRGPLP